MSKKWERTYPNNYLKRDLPCSEYKLDGTHSMLVIHRDKYYDFYIMEKSNGDPLGTPFMFAFGEPEGQMPYDEMIDMAMTALPHYYNILKVYDD